VNDRLFALIRDAIVITSPGTAMESGLSGTRGV
jgi:hypothetical protein